MKLARELTAEGYDALAVVDVGLSGASDERVLEFAVKEDRILVTLDADFANVLRFPADHTPGLVRLRIHPPTEHAIRDTIRKALLLLKTSTCGGGWRSLNRKRSESGRDWKTEKPKKFWLLS